MRFKYSVVDPSQSELDSLPRLELILRRNNRQIDVVGLVDSGAAINVLPFEMGVHLKETWDDRKAFLARRDNFPFDVDPTMFLDQMRDERVQHLFSLVQETNE